MWEQIFLLKVIPTDRTYQIKPFFSLFIPQFVPFIFFSISSQQWITYLTLCSKTNKCECVFLCKLYIILYLYQIIFQFKLFEFTNCNVSKFLSTYFPFQYKKKTKHIVVYVCVCVKGRGPILPEKCLFCAKQKFKKSHKKQTKFLWKITEDKVKKDQHFNKFKQPLQCLLYTKIHV